MLNLFFCAVTVTHSLYTSQRLYGVFASFSLHCSLPLRSFLLSCSFTALHRWLTL